jgi:hypothetical protein
MKRMDIRIETLTIHDAEIVFDWIVRLLQELGEEGDELGELARDRYFEHGKIGRTSTMSSLPGMKPAKLWESSLCPLHSQFTQTASMESLIKCSSLRVIAHQESAHKPWMPPGILENNKDGHASMSPRPNPSVWNEHDTFIKSSALSSPVLN